MGQCPLPVVVELEAPPWKRTQHLLYWGVHFPRRPAVSLKHTHTPENTQQLYSHGLIPSMAKMPLSSRKGPAVGTVHHTRAHAHAHRLGKGTRIQSTHGT
jgi:hypothetical protein